MISHQVISTPRDESAAEQQRSEPPSYPPVSYTTQVPVGLVKYLSFNTMIDPSYIHSLKKVIITTRRNNSSFISVTHDNNSRLLINQQPEWSALTKGIFSHHYYISFIFTQQDYCIKCYIYIDKPCHIMGITNSRFCHKM